jgi:phosphomannomutase
MNASELNIQHKFGNVYTTEIIVPHDQRLEADTIADNLKRNLETAGWNVTNVETFRVSTNPDDVSLTKKFTLIKVLAAD